MQRRAFSKFDEELDAGAIAEKEPSEGGVKEKKLKERPQSKTLLSFGDEEGKSDLQSVCDFGLIVFVCRGRGSVSSEEDIPKQETDAAIGQGTAEKGEGYPGF